MTVTQHNLATLPFLARSAAIAVVALSLGACAKVDGSSLHAGLTGGQSAEEKIAPANDLNRAVTYWGRKYIKHPTDKTAALNYAKNLKAAGHDKQAFRVLQHASTVHGNDREIASEYGRLALEQGQVALANKLLTLADDHSKPDWRIVSGRGAALAKIGKYGEAVSMFKRAHQLAPSNPTVLNNLAMAHAGNGDLKTAENYLREAAKNPMAKGKVNKNLALVLKLQGRSAEAANVGRPNYAAAAPVAPKPVLAKATKPAPRHRTYRRKARNATASLPLMRKSITPSQTGTPQAIVARSTIQ